MSGSHFIAQTSKFLLIDATAVTLGQGHGKVIQYISPDPYILCAKYPRKRTENTVNPDRGDLNIGSLFPYVYSIMKKKKDHPAAVVHTTEIPMLLHTHIYIYIHTEYKRSPRHICRHCHYDNVHSLWQLTVPPVTTKLSNRRYFVFSDTIVW